MRILLKVSEVSVGTLGTGKSPCRTRPDRLSEALNRGMTLEAMDVYLHPSLCLPKRVQCSAMYAVFFLFGLMLCRELGKVP